MEADELITESLIKGLARGDHHSVIQLRTVFTAMRDQIVRLEGNNDKLRTRVKMLLTTHGETEKAIVELKSRQSTELEEAKNELRHLRDQLEKVAQDSSTRDSRILSEKENLENLMAEKNKSLVKMRAENLMLKDQLEEQGLVFAQRQSRSAVTNDMITQTKDSISAVKQIQVVNNELLEKYAKEVGCMQQAYSEMKIANEELQLTIIARENALAVCQRKIKDDEGIALGEKDSIQQTKSLTEARLESTIGNFSRHIEEMRSHSQQHIEKLCRLAAFAETQLHREIGAESKRSTKVRDNQESDRPNPSKSPEPKASSIEETLSSTTLERSTEVVLDLSSLMKKATESAP